MRRTAGTMREARQIQKELQSKNPHRSGDYEIYMHQRAFPRSKYRYWVGTKMEWAVKKFS